MTRERTKERCKIKLRRDNHPTDGTPLDSKTEPTEIKLKPARSSWRISVGRRERLAVM
jgi:hypothetical protein